MNTTPAPAESSEQFQNKPKADTVPAYPGKRDIGQTVEDSSADGRCAEQSAPLAAGVNPRIAGAELTMQTEMVETAVSPEPDAECGQETTYQRALTGNRPVGFGEAYQDAESVTARRSEGVAIPSQSLNQAKDKSCGSGTGSTVDFSDNGPADTAWFCASDIARATGWHKKRVHRMAERDQWPVRQNRNRLEYLPPQRIADVVLAAPEERDGTPRKPLVKFADLAHSDSARQTVLWRQDAVLRLQNNLHLGKEAALQLICNQVKTERPLFHISVSALRRWTDAFAAHGIDGLVEQKRGRVGRKAYALDLDQEDLLRTAAAAVEYGTITKGTGKGRLNIARAYRSLLADPTVGGPARSWLHGAHASKSYVVPSVRDRIKAAISPLGTKLLQVGPKAARLDGPYTECSYPSVRAGMAFTADDMTANVYIWVEWPNEQGFLLIRPQILAVMDIGSMAWLNLRAIIRAKGQYNRDDVWGLIGDRLDQFGLHVDDQGNIDQVAILEGGTWQSEVVVGHKTGLEDKERIGGLQALGVKVIHTRSPRGKIIETAFNQLQAAADNCRGFCGRDERKDCPETVKAQLVQVRNGTAHPRQFFLHLSEYSAHLAGVMRALNNERNDGKILRGETPEERWAAEQPKMVQVADSAKWMYRAAYSVVQVTRNGVRVTLGTGKYQLAYTYANPTALENQRGRRVVVYWNDYNPDTDAVVYSIKNGRPDKFLCVASRVLNPDRLGASDRELAAEAARKRLAHNLAVSQSQSLAPYLQRRQAGVATSATADQVGSRLTEVRDQAEQKQAGEARTRAAVRRVDVSADDVSAASARETAPAQSDEISSEEIASIFANPEE